MYDKNFVASVARELINRISQTFLIQSYPNMNGYLSAFGKNRLTGSAVVTLRSEFLGYSELGFL